MKHSMKITAALMAATFACGHDALAAPDMLTCAISEVQECRPNQACKRVTPQDINMAPIITLDLAKRELVSASMTDSGRKENIEGVKTTDKAAFLHGQQDQETWSAAISLKDGSLSASVSAQGVGFVLFGNCGPK